MVLVESVREGILSRSLQNGECARNLDVLLTTEVSVGSFSCMVALPEAKIRNVDVESGTVNKVLSFGSG